MLGPLDIDLSKFGVSSKNGFLPDVNPLPRLEAFSEWEDLVDCIPKLLEEGSFRQHADALAILDTSNLHEEDEWRRAYHLFREQEHVISWTAEGRIYDEGEGKGEWRQYNGGSNAQSSLMQFWECSVGVKHVPTRLTGNTPEVISPKKGGNDFLDEMRNYMPGPHAAFLEKISEISPIHTYVNSSDCPSEVTQCLQPCC
ncbi:hypothetical protein DID88_005367 [Monilinia fructigena]|uniref:Indoleamine 2,3-dioxygenase n=1 Tax=Monilinia fructigena TaxID=38457 RepID=A0A395J4X7_9HELO|nr:hypothetical protein DID88_005367 [Monilinia fructigena]